MSKKLILLNLKNSKAPISSTTDACRLPGEQQKCVFPNECPKLTSSKRDCLLTHVAGLDLKKSQYTHQQLLDAFCMVKNSHNWKQPIRKLMDNPGSANIDCLEEAIVLITGSIPTFTRCEYCDKIFVSAEGYNRA